MNSSFINAIEIYNSTRPFLRPYIDKSLVAEILPLFNFVFIIFGTIGNLLTFAILIRKNVRKHSYMRYLASFQTHINGNINNSRTYTCYEPASFFVVWDVVHIIIHAKKMNLHCKSMSYSINKPIPVASETQFKTPIKDLIIQKLDKKKRVYKKSVNIQEVAKSNVEQASTSVATSNMALAVHARRSKKMQAKGFHVANLLLFLTVSFFFTTVPYSTFYALKLNTNLEGKTKSIVIGILTLLQYMRHSANFLIYLFTSSIIKNEINIIFLNFQRNVLRPKPF
ncbi:unnamed protein product [Brachionus calyciflorus]|uniref:G-protein coupled receptors family 1 profile domain-containing protein n=1 Tax=Brachionus calyciflorus TaxID=104777 RepID=A0A813WYG8_9BILA|nr:unnamed protein product [Brachionus calyciflorus]